MQPIRNVETNEVFPSISAAASHYGINPQSISSALYSNCAGGGYHWKRVTAKQAKSANKRQQANRVIREQQQLNKADIEMSKVLSGVKLELDEVQTQAIYRLVVGRLDELEAQRAAHEEAIKELNEAIRLYKATEDSLLFQPASA